MRGFGIAAIVALVAALIVIGGVLYFNMRPEGEVLMGKGNDMMHEGTDMVNKGSEMMHDGSDMMDKGKDMMGTSTDEGMMASSSMAH